MVQTKKTNPPAFGEILAGLGGGPERPAAGRAATASRGPAPAMDLSWIQSASMRASAAQMAQRVAAAAEPKKTGAGDRPRFKLDPTEGWGAAAEPLASPPEPEAGGTAASQSTGASGAAAFTMPGSPQPAHAPAGARSNPVHALWRLLGHIPGGWRAGAGVVASALAAARPARKPAASAPEPKLREPTKPKSEDEAIAEELGLRADLAIVDLRRIRRDFAKKNHPDRFEPAQRLGAARRMTIANMLIDAHMKQRPPSH
jgi:hypothetical protein